jgi:hypothetical protein
MNGVRLTANVPQVIHETIDGEVIAIDLATGSYYSLKGSAADAWALIGRPSGVDGRELLETLWARFDAPESELEVAFGAFLTELKAEQLVSVTKHAEPSPTTADTTSNGDPGAKVHFEPPLLEKFTDMQDLVLLDPVHEVGESGWPQRRPGDASA